MSQKKTNSYTAELKEAAVKLAVESDQPVTQTVRELGVNVVDDFNREALAIEIDLNLPATRVIRTLERVVTWRGKPLKVRVDSGPEFISLALAEWAEYNNVVLELIEPGKPTQNSYIERFNRTYRHEMLDFYIFSTLTEVRDITEKWLIEYNDERPHESLGDLSPWAFLAKQNDRMNANNSWH